MGQPVAMMMLMLKRLRRIIAHHRREKQWDTRKTLLSKYHMFEESLIILEVLNESERGYCAYSQSEETRRA